MHNSFHSIAGLSLFGKIPISRSCVDAAIPPTYCVCRNLTSLPITEPIVAQAAKVAVEYINLQIKDYHRCSAVSLDKVLSASITPLKTGDSGLHHQHVLVMFQTIPGPSQFDMNIKWTKEENQFSVDGPVGRVNLYGTSAWCMTSPGLVIYCHCRISLTILPLYIVIVMLCITVLFINYRQRVKSLKNKFFGR